MISKAEALDYYEKEVSKEDLLRTAYKRHLQQVLNQPSGLDLDDAVNVLGGTLNVVYIPCDLCEKGKITTRVRICGPVHYWKQKPCDACRGNGQYRFVMNGKRGHIDWRPSSGFGSVTVSQERQAIGFQPISTKSPSSPGAKGILSLLT